MVKSEFVIFIQARVNSSRFPGKILKKINKLTFLEILLNRLSKSKNKKKIIVLTTKNKSDIPIHKICQKKKINFFCGSENDLLDRYFQAFKKFKPKNIIRITSDCPLADNNIIDRMCKIFTEKNLDYISNGYPSTFPDGLDVEIFKSKCLKEAWKSVKKNNFHYREHVTPFIRDSIKYKKFNYQEKLDFSFLRLTLDEPEDYLFLKKLFSRFKSIYFNYDDILKLHYKNKEIFKINSHINRNEGENMPLGQKFWKRAKRVIPGGTMLFSKNPDLFLPKHWPAYFSRTKGCKVWSLENKKYFDLSFMGVGTNLLGYNNNEVEKKVIETIKKGNMSTLNSIEEILLSEKLINLHPWFDMARFTRSGGEANAVAIRIARAATGRDKVAVCGYHGWHDWYLACNIQNNNVLDKFLMKNVPIDGVPKNLKNSIYTFEYNDFKELEKIANNHSLAAIKMEVQRNELPKNNFLKKVRNLADKKKIVLIFDECTSGFRQAYGGIHINHKVYPDVAIFGKALGNGHAINAVLGKRSVMESIKNSFVSSTFWTERSGPAAALATLDEMDKLKSWSIATKIGKRIVQGWKKISNFHKVDIEIYDAVPSLANFKFKKNHFLLKTFLTQEMLKKGFLASNIVYSCVKHDDKILTRYFNDLDLVFKKIKTLDEKNAINQKILEGEICISGLR